MVTCRKLKSEKCPITPPNPPPPPISIATYLLELNSCLFQICSYIFKEQVLQKKYHGISFIEYDSYLWLLRTYITMYMSKPDIMGAKNVRYNNILSLREKTVLQTWIANFQVIICQRFFLFFHFLRIICRKFEDFDKNLSNYFDSSKDLS